LRANIKNNIMAQYKIYFKKANAKKKEYCL